jgi:WD40 repeat protein
MRFSLTRHTKSINTLAISPDGHLLLSGGTSISVILCTVLTITVHRRWCSTCVMGCSHRGKFARDFMFIQWSGHLGDMDSWTTWSWPSLCFRLLRRLSSGLLCWPQSATGKSFGVMLGHNYNELHDQPQYSLTSYTNAHDGSVEDIAFEQTRRRLASVGHGTLQVWSLHSDCKIFFHFQRRLLTQTLRLYRFYCTTSPTNNSKTTGR